jgi:hypothetical protein
MATVTTKPMAKFIGRTQRDHAMTNPLPTTIKRINGAIPNGAAGACVTTGVAVRASEAES